MQALTESGNIYQGGNFAEDTRGILSHFESEKGQGFGLYEEAPDLFPGKGSPSRKSRTNLSISVPRLPAGKQAITSPNSANTTYSPEDEPNMTVESRTPIAVAADRDTQPTLSEGPETQQARGERTEGLQHMASVRQQKHNVVAPAEPPKKKKSHARKQAPGHIPRPRNAFILFRKHITDNNLIPKSVEVKHQNISIVASKMWAEAPAEVKAQFTEAAKREKEEHARLYPNYRYQPAYRRTDIIRRRVRKDPLEDDKCDAVASLLIQGKAGNALETEVKTKIAEKTGLAENPEEITLVVKRGRRKRKDAPGELSKGAIRAEKAAERARAMREHWIDTSLLLAQQANSRAQHPRLAPAQYYDERYQHPNVVYVEEFGRPVHEDRYEPRYADARANEADFYPVEHYRSGMGPSYQVTDHYAGSNMMQMHPQAHHPFQMNLAPGGNQQQMMMEQPHMYDVPHHHNHAMQGQPIQYAPHPEEIPQQWGPAEQQNLLPFEQRLAHAPQEPMQMQAPMAPDAEHDANYALDPMLAANPIDPHADNTYDQFAQDGSDFPAMDEYRNISMPSDIIAGRWARDQDGTHEDEQAQEQLGNQVQEQAENMDNLLPFMEGEHLPSQHIDFGDKGELFGGDLNDVLPIDPDIEDYNAALHQQQDMEALLGQM